MKVAVIFLDYMRKTFSNEVLSHNTANAGHPFELHIIERLGLAAAFNEGLVKAAGADAFVFMANDITLPDNWLAEMVRHCQAIPKTGVIGIHTVEHLPALLNHYPLPIHVCFCPYGDQFIPAEVVRRIGGYNEDYDPYGMQDSDFALRAELAGFVNYYLPNMKANHVGHDVGQNSDYRRMKDEGLNQSAHKWSYWNDHYKTTGNLAHFTIEMVQFYGENNG